jgi:two-component system, OmpR family, alkaline phosphatase synthesis response regulator PhoP
MMRVLVVDDERSIVEVLQIFLSGEGYEVAIASNGEEGLAVLEQAQPDVVLCDVMMPVLDGREMYRQMRANDRYRSIPFILMSAVFTSVSLRDCTFSALLDKPFDLDQVLTTISQVVSGFHGQEEHA